MLLQSLMVSGTSRSERPCDKHTLYERIGAGLHSPLRGVLEKFSYCKDFEP